MSASVPVQVAANPPPLVRRCIECDVSFGRGAFPKMLGHTCRVCDKHWCVKHFNDPLTHQCVERKAEEGGNRNSEENTEERREPMRGMGSGTGPCKTPAA